MSDTPQVLLAYHLKALKLPIFLREYDKVARQCAAEGVDYPHFLLRLAEQELIDRERRMVEQGRVPGCGVGGGRRRCAEGARRATGEQRRVIPFPQVVHSGAGEVEVMGRLAVVRVSTLEQTGTESHDHRQSGNEGAA